MHAGHVVLGNFKHARISVCDELLEEFGGKDLPLLRQLFDFFDRVFQHFDHDWIVPQQAPLWEPLAARQGCEMRVVEDGDVMLFRFAN